MARARITCFDVGCDGTTVDHVVFSEGTELGPLPLAPLTRRPEQPGAGGFRREQNCQAGRETVCWAVAVHPDTQESSKENPSSTRGAVWGLYWASS